MVTFITTITPFLIILPYVLFIWWFFSILLNIRLNSKKQVEQNNEIIELLKKLNNKANENISS